DVAGSGRADRDVGHLNADAGVLDGSTSTVENRCRARGIGTDVVAQQYRSRARGRLPIEGARVEDHAVAGVAADDIPFGRRHPTDRRVRCLHEDPVRVRLGASTRQVDADVVALNDVTAGALYEDTNLSAYEAGN